MKNQGKFAKKPKPLTNGAPKPNVKKLGRPKSTEKTENSPKAVKFDLSKNKQMTFPKNSIHLPSKTAVSPISSAKKSILKSPSQIKNENGEWMLKLSESEEENLGQVKVENAAPTEKIKETKKRKIKVEKGEENSAGDKPKKKPKLEEMTKKERKKIRKQSDQPTELYEIGVKAKKIWEELRNSKCEENRKNELCDELSNLVKGHVKALIFPHDTSRVMECLVSKGNTNHRTLIFEELKSDLLSLCKAKYAKFFVLKIFKYGTKEQKNAVIQSFNGQVPKLLKHQEASIIVDTAFTEVANAKQRSIMKQEFYSPEYLVVKDENVKTLKDALDKEPTKKEIIFKYMKTGLLAIINKQVVNASMLHTLVREFLQECPTKADRSEVVEALRDHVVAILHTKDGSRVAMSCIWNSPAKDRKHIIKSFKSHVVKIACEEYGHLVLLAIFDAVDDTTLVGKVIIPELFSSGLDLSQNTHGRRVLVYLVDRRNPLYCPPSLIQILEAGDGNEFSKKDNSTRQSELEAAANSHFKKLFIDHFPQMRGDNSTVLFMSTILQNLTGDCEEVYKLLAEYALQPYQSNSNHPLEHGPCSILYGKLTRVKNASQSKCFGQVLAEMASPEVLRSWIEFNKGAFILVHLLELGIPEVTEKVKSSLEGLKNTLSKRTFVGAEILCSKLKKCT